MEKILVLTDLSDNSVNAYRYAVELACKVQGDILLVFSSNGEALTLSHHLQCSQRLHSFAKRYACHTHQKANPSSTQCLISNDAWTEALPLLINVHQPDLVVAGSGLLEFFQKGQQAWSLQNIEQCPVLWIPDKARFSGWHHLVYVTDFSDQDPAVVEQVKAFAALLEATVSLVHFYPKTDRNQLAEIKRQGEELHGLMNQAAGSYYLIEEEDMMEGLQEFTEQQPVDLFIIATKDSHLAQQYLRPTYRKTQACQTAIPLLNLYQEKKKSCAGNCEFCHQPQASAAALEGK
jgi:hypothetical protein